MLREWSMMNKRNDILSIFEDKHVGSKNWYINTLIKGIRCKKESKKKAILKEFEKHLGEK